MPLHFEGKLLLVEERVLFLGVKKIVASQSQPKKAHEATETFSLVMVWHATGL